MNKPYRKKPIERMTQREILDELIKLLRNQIFEKNRKFLNKEKAYPNKKSAYESYLEKIDDYDRIINYIDNWKSNLSYLKAIEKYIDRDKDDIGTGPSYYNMVISALYSLDVLTEEQKQAIITDQRLANKLLSVREKILAKKADLLNIPYQVKALTDIVELLKDFKEDDYIDEELINMIYSYYQSEQYTSYEDKVVNVGTYIVNYNILVHKKRTSR